MALLHQSCLRKCPHFPFWKGHCSCPFASAHWSSRSTIFTYNNASDPALLNLDCISLLTMPSVWTKNTYKGQVNLVSTQRAAGHQEKTPRNSCWSAQSLWLWSLASHWLPLPGGRRWTCFCDMLTTLPSLLNGHHMLVFLDSNKVHDWIITGWSGASGSESTRCFCPLLDSVCTK